MPHHEHPPSGITDEAALEAHDVIHHAEQEQHEHDAALKRGLPDQAVDAEREMMTRVEHDLEELTPSRKGAKAKQAMKKAAGGM